MRQFFFMRQQWTPGGSKLASALLAGALLVTAAGCNPGHTSYGENNPHGANGDDNGVKAHHYPDDGYLGTTHSYPRIPGHRLTLDYEAQAGSMEDAIRDVNGVTGANITYQGTEAFVTVRLRPDVRPIDRPRIEREVASVLRFNYPRYTIHVTSLR